MKKLMLPMIALVTLSGSALFAQDISGTWQGTLHGPKDLRLVMKISKADTGAGYKATMYSIDQGAQGIPALSVTLQGSAIKISIPSIGGAYEGKFSNTDATSITGTWTQGGPNPTPLDLTLANDKTAWAIPEPPPPPVPMAADAIPSFEVATIKRSNPDAQGIGIHMNGRNFSTRNTTLEDLITFAYGLHARQIIGAPGWLSTDKFDLAAIPDKPGTPNDAQLKGMVQKLMAQRFKLTFHHDKKELGVFLITVAKTGPKLTKNDSNGGLPGIGMGGMGRMSVGNATIADFAGVMQSRILDRPVVDQTGLTGRFNFTLQWTPDETQYGGRGGQAPPAANGGTAPPDLFNAMQEQLGLKIESTKAPVDVLVIDHVEKPSDN